MQYADWFKNDELRVISGQDEFDTAQNHLTDGAQVVTPDGQPGYVQTGASGRALVVYPVDRDNVEYPTAAQEEFLNTSHTVIEYGIR